MSTTNELVGAPMYCGPLAINLSPRISECCICGRELVDCRKAIPMYEGQPIPVDWEGLWAGFDACDDCCDSYEKGQSNDEGAGGRD